MNMQSPEQVTKVSAQGSWRTSPRPDSFDPPGEEGYQRCSRCVMDTTDPGISFDENGVCDHCINFDANVLSNWHTDERGHQELLRTVENNSIDRDGVRAGYDLELAKKVRATTTVPMTVLGGAGSLGDIRALIDSFGIIGASAGSLFVFKGICRAVLINYPDHQERRKLIG